MSWTESEDKMKKFIMREARRLRFAPLVYSGSVIAAVTFGGWAVYQATEYRNSRLSDKVERLQDDIARADGKTRDREAAHNKLIQEHDKLLAERAPSETGDMQRMLGPKAIGPGQLLPMTVMPCVGLSPDVVICHSQQQSNIYGRVPITPSWAAKDPPPTPPRTIQSPGKNAKQPR